MATGALDRMGAIYDRFPSPQETISLAAEALREGFAAEGVSVLVHDPARRELVFRFVRGGAEDLVGSGVADDAGVAGWAFRHGMVFVPDCAADRRFFDGVDKNTGRQTRSLLAAPFGNEGVALGVIELLNLPAGFAATPELERQARSSVAMTSGLIGMAYAAATLHEHLAAQKAALADANQRLEATVEARTRKLNQALERLKEQNALLEKTRHHALQSEKMAAIGQLAAGVAHEINNPIGFIASNLNTAREYWRQTASYLERLEASAPEGVTLLRKRYEIDLISEDMSRLVDECLEGTARVTNIVRNLKEFVHQGDRPVGETDVHQLIDRTVAIAISPYKHKVTVEREYAGPPSWVCNAQELGQVILNLVVNAAQAIPVAGRIRLRTGTEAGQLFIEVEDDGVGIPEALRGKIFEPFFTTKEVGVGTGLGLSTCFHLLKQAGGDITVRPVDPKGTVFRVVLPSREADA